MKQLRIASLTLVMILSSAASVILPQAAQAVSSGDWNASDIIDDVVFYNNTALSTDDIQAFMNSRNPNCDTQGKQPASEYGRPDLTHAQYAAQVGWPGPPYVCLRDYYQVPRSDQVVSNLSTNVIPSGAISAAAIIKQASDTYGVNPKVLLVMIQKESVGPLLTDTWPLPSQYKSVLGYACPDTAPCDPKYAGFYNQVMNAAYQFKYYKDHAYDTDQYGNYIYRHQPYNTVSLLYNPNAGCGSTQTRMDNYATTGLYNYTPYQPNQAALNNLYGSGDGCSAYGNRNFWRMFSDWFGSTRGDLQGYTNLSDPRWLQLTKDVKKISPLTSEQVDDTLLTGRQIQFTSKIWFNGEWCLRTDNDTRYNYNKCIPISATTELPITYTSLPSAPVMMETTTNLTKEDLRRSKNIGDPLPKMRQIAFSASTTTKYTDYYVTTSDKSNGFEYGIPKSKLVASPTYTAISPIWMELKTSTTKVSPMTGAATSEQFPAGMQRPYTSKAYFNNQWYYRTDSDTSQLLNQAFPESALQNLSFEPFSSPRWMSLNADVTKTDLSSNTPTGSALTAGAQLKFVSKIIFNGTLYFRTDADTTAGNSYAIPASKITDLSYEKFSSPRNLTLNKNAPKYAPAEDIAVDSTFNQGLTRYFTSKIYVNGAWYYRTETDDNSGTNKAFRASDLSEAQ